MASGNRKLEPRKHNFPSWPEARLVQQADGRRPRAKQQLKLGCRVCPATRHFPRWVQAGGATTITLAVCAAQGRAAVRPEDTRSQRGKLTKTHTQPRSRSRQSVMMIWNMPGGRRQRPSKPLSSPKSQGLLHVGADRSANERRSRPKCKTPA